VYEDEERHRCEIREWLRRGRDKPKEWVVDLLRDIAKRRGKPAAQRIGRDLSQQWKAGNRGEPGDWRQ